MMLLLSLCAAMLFGGFLVIALGPEFHGIVYGIYAALLGGVAGVTYLIGQRSLQRAASMQPLVALAHHTGADAPEPDSLVGPSRKPGTTGTIAAMKPISESRTNAAARADVKAADRDYEITRLSNWIPRVRWKAAEALGSIRDVAAVPALVKALVDRSDAVRYCAAQALGSIGDVSAVPALIEALKDRSANVRCQAVQSLGELGDVAAVPALLEVLLGSDPFAREYAAQGLGKLGDVAAVPALMEALQHDNADVRSGAAEALGEIWDVAAIPALAQALRDEDWMVRTSAVEFLDRVADVTAVGPLIQALKDSDGYVRRKAAHALLRIGGTDALPLKVLSATRVSAADKVAVLEEMGGVRPHGGASLQFDVLPLATFCQRVLNDGSNPDDVKAGAREVLNALLSEQLLRPGAADPSTQPEELLRAAPAASSASSPSELVRASDAPAENPPAQELHRSGKHGSEEAQQESVVGSASAGIASSAER
jgi:HEAT repeat protein